MLIQPVSDIHTEFHKDKGQKYCRKIPVWGDVLVIAGDFTTISYIYSQTKTLCERFKHVLYVPGNHEFWTADKERVFHQLDKLASQYDNFHWLYNSHTEIEGVKFFGGTMWFEKQKDSQQHEKYWSDFRRIKKLSSWVYKDNEDFRKMLDREYEPGGIIVTHHLPSKKSIHPMYKGEPTNRWYYTDMDEWILDNQPPLWIHGHTHEQFDYMIENTRVVANPRGYDGYEDLRKHNPDLVIEV